MNFVQIGEEAYNMDLVEMATIGDGCVILNFPGANENETVLTGDAAARFQSWWYNRGDVRVLGPFEEE